LFCIEIKAHVFRWQITADVSQNCAEQAMTFSSNGRNAMELVVFLQRLLKIR